MISTSTWRYRVQGTRQLSVCECKEWQPKVKPS
jgi:hypothetical protein